MSTTHERLSFSEFLARVERVARLFGQLARDGTSDGRSRVVIVTAMSFLGASAQAGTIAALNFFVKAIESEVPRVVPYLGFPIQSDARTLLALTVVVLGLQLVNAVAIYYVAITSRAIAPTSAQGSQTPAWSCAPPSSGTPGSWGWPSSRWSVPCRRSAT
jgi:hypothetical protein